MSRRAEHRHTRANDLPGEFMRGLSPEELLADAGVQLPHGATTEDVVRALVELMGPQVPHRPPVPLATTPVKYRAVDVPKLRDEFMFRCGVGDITQMVLNSHETSRKPLYFPHHRVPGGGLGPRWTVAEWMAKLRYWLANAELFYVTDEMTTVISRAASAMPTYEIVPDRLPAKIGFVVWGDTMCLAEAHDDNDLATGEQCRIVAGLWAEVEDTGDGPGIMFLTLQDSDVLIATRAAYYEDVGLEETRGIMGPVTYHEEYALPYGNRPFGVKEPKRIKNAAIGGLQSTLIMMTQRIASLQTENLPRSMRRRMEREGGVAPAIRTVTLRRAAGKPEQEREPGQESSRTYKHRWLVAGEDGTGYGYWRNTWYPSVGDHRLQYVWVPPYIKGPEGAPMLDSPKVNVLRR